MKLNQFPNFRQLIWSILVGISTHPRIKEPKIYFPSISTDPQELEEIKINKWRTYDGLEVQNQDLTCSVYPLSSSKKLNTITNEPESAIFEPYELGRKGVKKATYKIIVQLYYTGIAINNSLTLPYFVLKNESGVETPHGTNFAFSKDPTLEEQTKFEKYSRLVNGYKDNINSIEVDDLEIEINVGEEVLREYMDLLRIVLDDMPIILPWKIKSTQVKGYDFPTSSWSRDDPNVYFHTAYILWEICLYAPGSEEMSTMVPIPDQDLIESIKINSELIL